MTSRYASLFSYSQKLVCDSGQVNSSKISNYRILPKQTDSTGHSQNKKIDVKFGVVPIFQRRGQLIVTSLTCLLSISDDTTQKYQLIYLQSVFNKGINSLIQLSSELPNPIQIWHHFHNQSFLSSPVTWSF